jgi:hypothetical protein
MRTSEKTGAGRMTESTSLRGRVLLKRPCSVLESARGRPTAA